MFLFQAKQECIFPALGPGSHGAAATNGTLVLSSEKRGWLHH